jgi:hypothetical protein
VAHACNPSSSGSRNQEDCSSKPARQIVYETLPPRNPSQKWTGEVPQGEGPEFKLQYCKKFLKKTIEDPQRAFVDLVISVNIYHIIN